MQWASQSVNNNELIIQSLDNEDAVDGSISSSSGGGGGNPLFAAFSFDKLFFLSNYNRNNVICYCAYITCLNFVVISNRSQGRRPWGSACKNVKLLSP